MVVEDVNSESNIHYETYALVVDYCIKYVYCSYSYSRHQNFCVRARDNLSFAARPLTYEVSSG